MFATLTYHCTFLKAASWVENDNTVLIDASTAFRVDDDWTYGFPGEMQAAKQIQ